MPDKLDFRRIVLYTAIALLAIGGMIQTVPMLVLMIVSFGSVSFDPTYEYDSTGREGKISRQESNYHRDSEGHIYYRHSSLGSPKKILAPAADPTTFIAIEQNLAKDASHVWAGASYLPNAHAPSLRKIPGRYFADDRTAYDVNVQAIEWSDPKTFEVLPIPAGFYPGYSNYSRDARSVYYGSGLVVGADPAGFSVSGEHGLYGSEGRHVYYVGSLLPDIDAGSWHLIEGSYAIDSDSVYCLFEPIAWADPATFEAFGLSGYSRDARHVYFGTGVVAGADPATFDPRSAGGRPGE